MSHSSFAVFNSIISHVSLLIFAPQIWGRSIFSGVVGSIRTDVISQISLILNSAAPLAPSDKNASVEILSAIASASAIFCSRSFMDASMCSKIPSSFATMRSCSERGGTGISISLIVLKTIRLIAAPDLSQMAVF